MPDDPFFEEMDEYMWVWMYQSWLQDQKDLHKDYKDYALFLGSFFNSEAAQEMAKRDNPDYESTDEEMEEATDVVRKVREVAEQRNKVDEFRHRRRRVQR